MESRGSSLHVGYGEIVRGAVEAIRMVGLPFGHADDCAEGFTWTQSVLGRGYDLLRLADERRPQNGWTWPNFSALELHPGIVELDGLALFAYAARLADLALAAIDDGKRVASIVALGASGGWIAPYAAHRIARAGLEATVLWKPASEVAGDAPGILATAVPEYSSEVRRMRIAPRELYRAESDGSEPPRLPEELVEPMAQTIAQIGDRSVFAVFAVDPGYEGSTISISSLAGSMWDASCTSFGTFDPQARLRAAIDHGFQADAADHRFFTSLLRRIRLPNSERSSNQAG